MQPAASKRGRGTGLSSLLSLLSSLGLALSLSLASSRFSLLLCTRRLQAAEAAYLVGDVNVAISRYGQIKRWLDPGRGEWSAESPDAANAAFLHRVAAFVDSRIAALAKSSHAH
jgi:hypothetical protein